MGAEKELDTLLESHRARLAARLKKGPPYTWKNFVMLLDEMADERHQFWSPIDHLSNVQTSQDPKVREATRKVVNRCWDKIVQFETELSQSKRVFRAYKYLADGRRRSRVTKEQAFAIKAVLEGARLAGVELPADKKKKFKKNNAKLAQLETQFANNVLDAAGAWEKLVPNKKILAGISEAQIEAAGKAASEKGQDGYLFTLGDATLMTVLETAKNRNLRRTFYRAWISRAAKKLGDDIKLNNTPVIENELALRYELAHILGHSNYAELSLAYKMAESTTKVRRFLNELYSAARPAALREHKQLLAYAKQHDSLDHLEPWDINYYLEQVKAEKRGISQEELRKYFPLPTVFEGMLAIANRLYGITFKQRTDVELWHSDAKLFEVYNSDGALIAGMYTDLYERPGQKRGSAWMQTAVNRRELSDGSIQLPVGYLNCNFIPPANGLPSLLTMTEVETLLHEFGHNLHLLLTEVKELETSGLALVLDDAVELPSQFMESFCWEREGLDLLSGHVETGEKLPYKIYRRLRAAKTFGYGLSATWLAMRALFDFRLHIEYTPGKTDFAHTLYREIQDDHRPIFMMEYPWAPESFLHIFGGDGVEAGYFGYPWSKMLAVDVFEAFLVDGKIDWELGKRLHEKVLSKGGSRLFMDCFVAFRRRKPATDALLRWYGFVK